MLVLTRKPGEKVVIGNNIILTVIKCEGNQVRLTFEAPAQVRILREELLNRQDQPMRAERQSAATEADTPELVLSGQSE